ncbi:ABC transporter permease subunit [Clostridium gasigenes]|uniref:ABC transporter permease subunit n=1 Tax=Clostridium gasigenes TaxID=94869 RepID=UPI00143857CA|nr:ABC transporter permease subunit [Clostridium gasigenes]NKF07789.1 ABC transporter permease subunit [Clostridium gasigenes]QSW20443.1 ABC transporter permease subunit [Clostridium gasigenes]
MLFVLIKNELRKLIAKPKTWIVFILFAIFVGITIFGQYKVDKSMRYNSSPEYQLENAKSNLEYYTVEINKINDTAEDKKAGYVETLNSYVAEKAKVEESIKAYEDMIKNGNDEEVWKLELDNQINNQKETIKSLEDKGINEYNQNQYLKIKQELEYNNNLKDNNIKPLNGWEFEAYAHMKTLMGILGMGILVAGIAVFMSDIVSGECTPATLKFLLVQPIKRGAVLLSKFISVVIMVLAMILGLELTGFGVMNALSKIEGGSYPVIIGKIYESKINVGGLAEISEKVGTGNMVTNNEMFIKALILQALFIITTCAVIFLISSIIKSSMVTMGLSVILLVFATILSVALSSVKKIAHLLFVNYGDPIGLLTGDSVFMYNNVNMTIKMGIIVMIITTVVSYVIAHVVFTKRDILI